MAIRFLLWNALKKYRNQFKSLSEAKQTFAMTMNNRKSGNYSSSSEMSNVLSQTKKDRDGIRERNKMKEKKQ